MLCSRSINSGLILWSFQKVFWIHLVDPDEAGSSQDISSSGSDSSSNLEPLLDRA